ncbi:YceI family protein [Foetidibacter luteolus]|uniref:YceI family protein n=1 Tax=Foetidibacter luteolus TaxID=2608880 RepID=UPI00129A9137|nr:YceI family protein [Foetidibacter luteolus]
MKKIQLLFILLLSLQTAFSQLYITRNGLISFYSHTALEDINASNNEVASVLNSATGDFEFKVAIKSFHFKKTAMEEHFNNASYMDSEKYPRAGFKGKVTNISTVDFSKDGVYKVTVEGNLTIKDVTKPVTVNGSITVKSGAVSADAVFNVLRKDYNILGESFVQKKIAEQIQVTIKCSYDKR